MAGLIAALFGGKARPPDPDPLPGLGGVRTPYGKTGEGFPGSTNRTRTFPGNNPRQIPAGDWTTIKADTNTGWDSALSDYPQTRQASYRPELATKRGGTGNNPRTTPEVVTPQPQLTRTMQETPATFYGGPKLKTGGGNDTAGGELSRAYAQREGQPYLDPRDTTTLWKDAHVIIGDNIPGGTNVRNQITQRYKNAPGQQHTYWAAYRADQANVNPGGQATDGNVQIHEGQQQVTVPNRFTMNPGNGNRSWSIEREMPYGGRGNGARGADLNGQRYYAQGQNDQFWNAGQGDYGVARLRGGDVKRPVSFTEPAPWTSNFYDTTDSVGTPDQPNDTPGQAPDMVYISPTTGRARNSTGRTG